MHFLTVSVNSPSQKAHIIFGILLESLTPYENSENSSSFIVINYSFIFSLLKIK